MDAITKGVNNMNVLDSYKKNHIQVTNTKKPLFFYVNLAKRYMQQHNEVKLSALRMVPQPFSLYKKEPFGAFRDSRRSNRAKESLSEEEQKEMFCINGGMMAEGGSCCHLAVACSFCSETMDCDILDVHKGSLWESNRTL